MEDAAVRQRKGFSLITRRNFLTASATLIYAPAVVRAASLMQVRGVALLTDRPYFGFVERLYVNLHFPTIVKLQNVGLSAREIAEELNKRQVRAINGDAWDAHHVICVVRGEERIRRADFFGESAFFVRPRSQTEREMVSGDRIQLNDG